MGQASAPSAQEQERPLLSPTARDILNRPDQIARRDAGFERLRSVFRGEPQAEPFRLRGRQGFGTADPYREPEIWMEEALEDAARKALPPEPHGRFEPVSVNFWPCGVHFVDALFGAHVFDLD
ncbi:MAG: hypothetical protein E4H17_01545 [Gemmatimonadales bacterium]|nr:MAG: hypothetical protein E4H17_01545 [Gemmatimonadales bacterium]